MCVKGKAADIAKVAINISLMIYLYLVDLITDQLWSVRPLLLFNLISQIA